MLADLPICSRISTDRVELRVSDRTRATDQPDGQDSRSAQWLPLAVGSRVNTDESVDRAGTLGIRSIPTLVFYSNGQEADRMTGFAPKPALKAKLDALLKTTAG